MKFSLAVTSLLVGSAAAWSSMSMKAGKWIWIDSIQFGEHQIPESLCHLSMPSTQSYARWGGAAVVSVPSASHTWHPA